MHLMRGRAFLILCLAFLLLGATGWLLWYAKIGRSEIPVIIYVVDTLRADRLEIYGHERPTSPNINTLAEEAVIFDQAYAPAPWTLPSLASILTSTYACEHQVTEGRRKLSPSLHTLAQRMTFLEKYLMAKYPICTFTPSNHTILTKRAKDGCVHSAK